MPKQLEEYSPRVVVDERAWSEAILQRIAQESQRTRAVLVICQYLEQARRLKETVRAAAPLDRSNFTGVVLGCIETKFCN